LRQHLQLDRLLPSTLEQVTYAQLAVRVAVATLWAANGRKIPAFHVFGTELPLCLQGKEFTTVGLPNTSNLPPPTKASWFADTSPLTIQLPGPRTLNLATPPYLVLTSYQSSAFDIMMGMCTTGGEQVFVLIDCTHTTQLNPTNTPHTLGAKLTSLHEKIGQLRARTLWPANTQIVPAVVTNRVVADDTLRKKLLDQGVMLIDGSRFATFFSPTTASLLTDCAPFGTRLAQDLVTIVNICSVRFVVFFGIQQSVKWSFFLKKWEEALPSHRVRPHLSVLMVLAPRCPLNLVVDVRFLVFASPMAWSLRSLLPAGRLALFVSLSFL
jgi:hypothetical protein